MAVALRNRWRRRRLAPDLIDEVTPKNILMIGPTGVGKTEIARRLARLAQSPFLKVEATKFTEVGYVGRDVDQIIRDLVESALVMVREKRRAAVQAKAEAAAEERILDALVGATAQPAHPRQPSARSCAPASWTTRRWSSISPIPAAACRTSKSPASRAPPWAWSICRRSWARPSAAAQGAQDLVSGAWAPLIAEESDKLLDHEAVTAGGAGSGRERRHRVHR